MFFRFFVFYVMLCIKDFCVICGFSDLFFAWFRILATTRATLLAIYNINYSLKFLSTNVSRVGHVVVFF